MHVKVILLLSALTALSLVSHANEFDGFNIYYMGIKGTEGLNINPSATF
jgi:hypothetical protein